MMDTESKTWKPHKYRIYGVGTKMGWRPSIGVPQEDGPPEPKTWIDTDDILMALHALHGRASTRDIALQLKMPWPASRNKLLNQLHHRENRGTIRKHQTGPQAQILWSIR